MLLYKIANIIIGVSTSSKYIINRLYPFIYNGNKNHEFVVFFEAVDNIHIPKGDYIINEKMNWIRKLDGGYFGYTSLSDDKATVAIDSDIDWENNTVYYLNNIVYHSEKSIPDILAFQFFGLIFRNYIVKKNSVVLHSSCISFNNKGIAFSAPSGTGKSTHVSLWEKYKKNTVVINDDTPVLQINNDETIIHGTPWSGASDKFLNMSVPLHAIVILEQYSQNSIKQLSIVDALSKLLPRVLLPFQDKELMDLAINTIEHILVQVPVYQLKCKPDYEAVETVFKCLKL